MATLLQAIWLLTTGARESAFRNIKTIAECLADELVNAAKGSSNRCGPMPQDIRRRIRGWYAFVFGCQPVLGNQPTIVAKCGGSSEGCLH